MANSKKVGAAALLATVIAIPAEGLRQYAYYDPPGVLTVCYGHTGKDIVKNRQYSLAECKSLLTAEMAEAVDAVDRCHPNLPVEVLAAFGDAAYNLGSTIACDKSKSTAARYLYQGKLIEACNQLPNWNKSRIGGVLVPLPGLTTRRSNEKELCLRGAA
ncbi:lysozyme [Undibacterium sp. Rencai35W]|uniref:lysozyme n=1 Tax=Undibacterium sp. Rencai35W TaxID=3413046 RepID=UPI003BF43180